MQTSALIRAVFAFFSSSLVSPTATPICLVCLWKACICVYACPSEYNDISLN